MGTPPSEFGPPPLEFPPGSQGGQIWRAELLPRKHSSRSALLLSYMPREKVISHHSKDFAGAFLGVGFLFFQLLSALHCEMIPFCQRSVKSTAIPLKLKKTMLAERSRGEL
jgi:hypothetical protein